VLVVVCLALLAFVGGGDDKNSVSFSMRFDYSDFKADTEYVQSVSHECGFPVFGNDGELFTLRRNVSASSSSLPEVFLFLQGHPVVKVRYERGVFDCKDYAKQILESAERNGVRTDLVFVRYTSGESHVFVRFALSDGTFVFADVNNNTVILFYDIFNHFSAHVENGYILTIEDGTSSKIYFNFNQDEVKQ
jgi:hypothetical protein